MEVFCPPQFAPTSIERGRRFDLPLAARKLPASQISPTYESARYEFLCRRAGVNVVHCAEPFASGGYSHGEI